MSYAKQMLESYPGSFGLEADLLARSIDAILECAQACTACADACLAEENAGELAKCIRLELDCSDQCLTTARVLSRQTEYDANVTRAVVEACRQVCKSCGDECESHGEHGMEHCRVCAEACRRCEEACDELLSAIG